MNTVSADTRPGDDEPYRTLFSAVGEAITLCEIVCVELQREPGGDPVLQRRGSRA